MGVRNGACYQVRDLSLEERLSAVHRGVQDPRHDFSKYFDAWQLLEKLTR